MCSCLCIRSAYSPLTSGDAPGSFRIFEVSMIGASALANDCRNRANSFGRRSKLAATSESNWLVMVSVRSRSENSFHIFSAVLADEVDVFC